MNALELVPHLTMEQSRIVGALIVLAIAVGAVVAAFWADHVATEWQADQYEAGQSPTEGHIARPRIPEQRRPDQDAS